MEREIINGVIKMGAEEMFVVFVRGLILYILVVIVMRMMGKRQMAQMQPFELVITLMIADLAATPMENTGVPLINGIVPIITLLSVQVIASYISLKSERFREIICGRPRIIINKGSIVQSELKSLRINLNDLMEQLRSKDYHDISDVEFAILETNGDISVIPKVEQRQVKTSDFNLSLPYEDIPVTLILDGKLNQKNLSTTGRNINWLIEELKQLGISAIEDVFFAFMSSDNKLYAQRKDIKEGAGGT